MLQAGFAEQLQDARHQRHVGAAEDAEAEPVGVLVGDGADHGLGRLPQAGVDDVHAGVAQGPGHDLDAAIMAVEPDLGQHDADGGGAVRHANCSVVPGNRREDSTLQTIIAFWPAVAVCG